MELKEGVSVRGVQPELILGLRIVESVLDSFDIELVVTSITDGSHMANSLHGFGLAADIRSRDIPKDKLDFVVASCRRALGKEFDLVVEADHLHLEYDPK